MTVLVTALPSVRSHVRQSEKTKSAVRTLPRISVRWNIALGGLVVSVFAAYLVCSIMFSSSQYALSAKRSEYRRVNTAYAATQTSLQGSNAVNDLISFSQRSGMIDASKESPVVMYAKDHSVALH